MTPKEKAEELVDSFEKKLITFEGQKKCALILIDEIILAAATFDTKYWQEVKTEIESL